MLRTPDYHIENHAEVYDFYRDYEPHEAFARHAYKLLKRIMQPNISYDNTVREQLAEMAANNTPTIITLNHLSDRHDQWTSAAIASRVFPEKVGDIRVLAKSTFYTGELLDEMNVPQHRIIRPIAQRAVTTFVNNMGTVPIYRPNDQSSEQRKLSLAAADSAWSSLGNLLESGHPVAIYAEGTADTVSPQKNLAIKAGIGHLALQTLREGRQPGVIVPIGVSYPEYTQRINRKGTLAVQPTKLKRAHAHVGTPYHIQSEDTVRSVQATTARILQSATTRAFASRQPVYLDTEGRNISDRFPRDTTI